MKKLTVLLLVYMLLFISQTNAQIFINYTVASTSTKLCDNRVNVIAIDTEGNKWFGTRTGVSKFNGTAWTNYTTADGLADDYISSIAIDAMGNKWFGTWGGVSKFDDTTWTTYTKADGLANNNVQAIAIDAEGNKWFGTGEGVSKFDGTTWTTYTTADGLINNDVYAIAIDAEGNKWFGTNGGVSKLSDEGSNVITNLTNKNHLNIFPHPVQNVFHVNLPEETGLLQVYDISGKNVLQKQITGKENSVDISGLGNGVYIVRILHGNQVYTGKVVKY